MFLGQYTGFGTGGSEQGYNFVISASEDNWNLDTELASAGYVEGVVNITITVNGGVVVGSTTATAGMTLQAQEAGSTILLTNNGTINGRGGTASGGTGGDALLVQQAVTLVNNGTIFGGGGGGGVGGNMRVMNCRGTYWGYGGNGGVGEGNSTATGGAAGSNASGTDAGPSGEDPCADGGSYNITGGTGGTGGTKGVVGSTGAYGTGSATQSGTSSFAPGVGGGAGNWVNGHSYLTIDVAGTVYGGTTG